MKKLKTILQSKLFLALCCFIIIVYVGIRITKLPFEKRYLGANKMITGVISNFDDGGIIVGNYLIFADITSFKLGMTVRCTGEVSLPSSNTNFNLFNYQNYLASKSIYYILDGKCQIINGQSNLLYILKNNLLDYFNRMKSKAYLKTFIFGITDDIESEVNENYRFNGINHLFSISGMHLAFILSFLTFIKNKFIISLILLIYLYLLDFPASMTRAVLFFIVLNINRITEFNLNSKHLFLYFTMVMLLINPYNIYNIGFVYSYIISFFLIFLKDKLNTKNYILNLLKISVIAFIVSIPINIQNNFYLNFITPFLNILFVPMISFLLFPLSFITAIFPFFDGGYYLLCSLVENISNFIALNVKFILPFHKMNLAVLFGYYIIIIFIMHKIKLGTYKYIVVLVIVLILHYFYPFFKQDGMVLMLDVKQGDSILITYPFNKLNILIDTGGYYNSKIIKNITIPTLRSFGIKKLDYLIITHGDYDHAGETLELLQNYSVKKVLLNSTHNNELENSVVNYLDKNNIAYDYIQDDIVVKNNIELKFLNRGSNYNENDDSLVLLLTINKYKVLLMGDASSKIENKILDEYNLGEVDILKVGHHGSKTSSSLKFLKKIKPRIALISVGKNNIFGHPHQQVIKNLQLSDTYVTSIDGAIKLSLGNSILVQTVR